MNREMISHYGWIVVVTIILALMMAFATPFGSFVGTAVLNTTNGFIDAGEKATSEDNMQELENKWEDKIDKLSNTVGFIENDNSTDIKVPSGEVLGTLEHPVQTGDYYIDGDMIYRYNYHVLTPDADVNNPDDNTPPVWKWLGSMCY